MDYVLNQLSQLGEQVIVDCGHASVRSERGQFFVGRDGSPTATEKLSLQLGIRVVQMLRSSGREAHLSICFSDTTRQLQESDRRIELKNRIDNGTIQEILPESYLGMLKQAGIAPESCRYSLQTRNSNRFSKALKVLKCEIRKPEATVESIFRRYGALFLNDAENDLFGFTTPFLLNPETEIQALGGSWWLNDQFEPTDRELVKAPFLRLKQMKVVNLYSRSAGILCPATYGGLLLSFEEHYDHISIYSRADDPFIGEKVLRGVLAAQVVSPGFNRTCMQITLPETGTVPEVSLVQNNVTVDKRDIAFEQLMSRYFYAQLSTRCEACA